MLHNVMIFSEKQKSRNQISQHKENHKEDWHRRRIEKGIFFNIHESVLKANF